MLLCLKEIGRAMKPKVRAGVVYYFALGLDEKNKDQDDLIKSIKELVE